jgi:VCBS repeat-containing protein
MTSTDASLSANEWHYVALARTSGVFHLFVDGLEHAITNSTTAVNNPTSGALTMIGGNNVVASETFSGSIGEVKIVNTGLNGDAMGRRGEMYTEGSSGALVANWRFNDGSGNIALDSQGPTLENLTISGTPTWVTNNANGWTSVLHANEDLPVRFGALSVSDVDAGSQPVSVTLSVLHGVLSPADQGGTLSALGLMVAGWDTPTFTLTGTLSGINAALSHGIYYKGAANYNGNDTLTITTSDKGNTGTDPGLTGGTGFEQDVDLIPITVAAINDAPVITSTAPAATGAVKEDTTFSATGQLSATDVDQGTTLLWSVLGGATGAYGSLAVNGATGQWTYSLANSSSAVQSLGAGETRNESFTVQVSDGNGGLATQAVTVAVTGTNPTPISEWMANGNALDSIAPTNNGTMLNGVAFVAGRNGGQAFGFDGVNDYVSVVREIGGDFTITGWLNTNVQAPGGSQFYSGDGLVYADVGGLAADFGVSVLGDRLAFGTGGFGDQTIVSTSSVTSGQWVSFAAVRSGSTISLYVNGTLEASIDTGYPYALTSPSTITFGANTVDGLYYRGLLDDVSFFNSALPSAEIVGIAHTNPA